MGVDLHDRQLAEHRDQGKITGADGRGYARRGTKTERKTADTLMAQGTPLVADLYSSGQFEWFEGDEATSMWSEVRPNVTSSTPTAKQLKKAVVWNAGIWEAEDGSVLLYLTGTC